MSTSLPTIKWIENIADQEARILAGERGSFDLLATKEDVLAVETLSFVKELFDHFSFLSHLFCKRVGGKPIAIQRGEDLREGFALSRDSVRLWVAMPRPGVIQLSCDRRNLGEVRSMVLFSGTAEAQFGAFHTVTWVFLGEPVSSEQLAQHYLTEFVQIR